MSMALRNDIWGSPDHEVNNPETPLIAFNITSSPGRKLNLPGSYQVG